MQTNLEKLIEFDGWRPIEDAPKDGTEVLLKWSYVYPGDTGETCGIELCFWDADTEHWMDDEGRQYHEDLFTHYQPRDALGRLAKVARCYREALLALAVAHDRVGNPLNPPNEARAALEKAEQIAGETPCSGS